jgi:polysaccharide export outer membrane protein
MVALLAVGCVSPRRINYLQDMTPLTQIELEHRFEAKVAPYDELSINISSPSSPELATPFNNSSAIGGSYNQGYRQGYLVDVNGNIDMPFLGRLHVAGLTRLQLQDTLAHMLRNDGYISDPFVNVRFSNFKIFFLGSNRASVINIPNESCTFLQAIAMMGGLDNYTRRDRIAVMREVDGHMVMRYLDPRSSDVFNDPFFMLQQNDFIIVDNFTTETLWSETNKWIGIVSMMSSIASLAVTVMLYLKSND